jgi:hypothetical protein
MLPSPQTPDGSRTIPDSFGACKSRPCPNSPQSASTSSSTEHAITANCSGLGDSLAALIPLQHNGIDIELLGHAWPTDALSIITVHDLDPYLPHRRARTPRTAADPAPATTTPLKGRQRGWIPARGVRACSIGRNQHEIYRAVLARFRESSAEGHY